MSSRRLIIIYALIISAAVINGCENPANSSIQQPATTDIGLVVAADFGEAISLYGSCPVPWINPPPFPGAQGYYDLSSVGPTGFMVIKGSDTLYFNDLDHGTGASSSNRTQFQIRVSKLNAGSSYTIYAFEVDISGKKLLSQPAQVTIAAPIGGWTKALSQGSLGQIALPANGKFCIVNHGVVSLFDHNSDNWKEIGSVYRNIYNPEWESSLLVADNTFFIVGDTSILAVDPGDLSSQVTVMNGYGYTATLINTFLFTDSQALYNAWDPGPSSTPWVERWNQKTRIWDGVSAMTFHFTPTFSYSLNGKGYLRMYDTAWNEKFLQYDPVKRKWDFLPLPPVMHLVPYGNLFYYVKANALYSYDPAEAQSVKIIDLPDFLSNASEFAIDNSTLYLNPTDNAASHEIWHHALP